MYRLNNIVPDTSGITPLVLVTDNKDFAVPDAVVEMAGKTAITDAFGNAFFDDLIIESDGYLTVTVTHDNYESDSEVIRIDSLFDDSSSIIDSDLDGILDVVEHFLGTDPYDSDTDDDGIEDFMDYWDAIDSDLDGLSDQAEIFLGLNFMDADSDGDGIKDALEKDLPINIEIVSTESDVACEGKVWMEKTSGSGKNIIICVSPSTAQVLDERGWGKYLE